MEGKSYWFCVFMLVLLTLVFRFLVILILACQDNSKSKGMHDTRNTEIRKGKSKVAAVETRA